MKKKILGCCLLIIFLLLGRMIYLQIMQSVSYDTGSDSESPEYVLLNDEYDANGGNYFDFLEEKDALKILKQVYEKLNHTKDLDYYEISRQDMVVYGKFLGSESFTNGTMNKKTDQHIETKLKAFQLPEKVMEKENVANSMESGRSFLEKEYNTPVDQVIPVIAGYKYKNVYRLNQKIKGGYVGEEAVTYQIIGFLNKDTEFNTINDITADNLKMDDRMIMPTIDPTTDSDQADKKGNRI